MKNLLIVFLLFSIHICGAQTTKLKEYKASNGVTYKVGDKIKMGRGSGINGSFVYLRMGGIMMSANTYQNQLPPTYAGLDVTIKKIKDIRHKRLGNSVVFTVGGGNITNYTLDIENAIATCEVDICNDKPLSETPQVDKYDQLAKLKKLFDTGVLSEEEYKTEKKKLIKQ